MHTVQCTPNRISCEYVRIVVVVGKVDDDDEVRQTESNKLEWLIWLKSYVRACVCVRASAYIPIIKWLNRSNGIELVGISHCYIDYWHMLCTNTVCMCLFIRFYTSTSKRLCFATWGMWLNYVSMYLYKNCPYGFDKIYVTFGQRVKDIYGVAACTLITR